MSMKARPVDIRRKGDPVLAEQLNTKLDAVAYERNGCKREIPMKDISDANILLTALERAIKTSKWKTTCLRADHNALSLISDLQTEIRTGTYHTEPTSTFVISERGKTRVISGNTIKDRTLRHAMCDEFLMPAIADFLIYDNSASQPGKGVDFARRRLRCHLQRYYRKHGNRGYILLIDFSKYYDNILHGDAYRMLAGRLESEQVKVLLAEIFRSFALDGSDLPEEAFDDISKYKYDSVKHFREHRYEGQKKRALKKSVPIGDQTSQVVGIYYPHEIDNYCKIVKGLKYYGRYMDDIYIIHESKEYLTEVLEDIRAMTKRLGIFINEDKTQIFRLDKPFHFLQNSYYITETGRVVEKISKKRVKRMRRKLKKLAPRVQNGEIPKDAVESMYRSWTGGYYKTMSKKQLQSLNNLYSKLYEGEQENGQ